MMRRAAIGLWERPEDRYLLSVSSGIHSDPADWSDARHQRGLAGEEQAIRYLQARGWEVVAHRFRVGRIEVDLIARRGFLAPLMASFGSPFEAIRGAKRREIVEAA